MIRSNSNWWGRRGGAIVRWVLFTFLVSVFPLAIRWAYLRIDGEAYGSWEIVGNGELFLISCSVAAAALGDIIGQRHERDNVLYLMSGFFCVMLILFSAGLWGKVAGAEASRSVAQLSLAFFGASAVAGLWTKILESRAAEATVHG